MFDTLHLEAPRIAEYAAGAHAILRDLDRLTGIGKGGGWQRQGSKSPYERVGNLVPYGLPMLVHQMPRWNYKGGDKVEFIGASKLSVKEMTGLVRELYRINAAECTIPRIDCTADVRDVPVEWFWKHARVLRKQRSGEVGTWQKNRKALAETITAGRRTMQTRIYDKTGERTATWMAEQRKLPKDMREAFTFETMHPGHTPFEMITRVERQLGARQAEKLFNVRYFGEIAMMAKAPVFGNIRFAEHLLPKLRPLKGEDNLVLQALETLVQEGGLLHARNVYRRQVPERTYKRKWSMYEAYLLQPSMGEKVLTLDEVTQAYRDSCYRQLLQEKFAA